MKKCITPGCGSHAINHKHHGRDGSDPDSCDVCFWRNRAGCMKLALTAIADAIESHPAYMGAGRSDHDLDNEGGDAATLTELAYIARAALGAQE